MTTASTHAKAHKFTSEQTAAIKSELDCLLNSVQFSGTRRCCEFLEFVVNHALAGDYESLTERTLGAELFGRPIDYETGNDAIVRVRANDVRRRLAQYYSEQHLNSQVIIGLPTGTYVPEFHSLSSEVKAAPTDPSFAGQILTGDVRVSPPKLVEPSQGDARRRPWKQIVIGAALLFAVSGGLARYLHNSNPPERALRQFWQPVIQEHSPVIVCFGNADSFWPSATMKKQIDQSGGQSFTVDPGEVKVTKDDSVTIGNLRAAVSILNQLSSYGVTNELRWPQEVQSAELERSTVIYIGAFNNPWSMSLDRDLRFSFKEIHTPAQSTWWIQDRKSPGQKWSITKVYPEQMGDDYAIITRIIDHEGKRVVISVGGLSQFGTQAAGEFLTNEEALSAFAHGAPAGWEQRNIQIVLGMRVDGKKIVSPKILAINVW